MSSMTKSQLIAVLNQNNISLPPSGSRKEEYEKLYFRHLAPKNEAPARGRSLTPVTPVKTAPVKAAPATPVKTTPQPKKLDISTYSTDEEEEDNITPAFTPPHLNGSSSSGGSITISPMSSEQATKVVNRLNDKDLYDMLVELDYKDKIGPVLPSTRAIYRQMLKTLLMGNIPFSEPNSPSSSNGGEDTPLKSCVEQDFGSEFSDSDRESENINVKGKRLRAQFEEAYLNFNETEDASFEGFDLGKKKLGSDASKQRRQGLSKRRIRDVASEIEQSTSSDQKPAPNVQLSSESEATVYRLSPKFKTPRNVEYTKSQGDSGRRRGSHISPLLLFVILLMVCVGLLFVYKSILEDESNSEMDAVDREIEEIVRQG